MWTIDRDHASHTSQPFSCLGCGKLVAPVPILLTIEVTSGDGTLIGYLHKNCRAAWAEKNPDDYKYEPLATS